MRIGITLGDPAGVGPETVLRALQKTSHRDILLIGSAEVLACETKRLKIEPPGIGLEDTGPVGRYRYGLVQKSCGRAAWQALEKGVELLKKGVIGALVTAPVSKEALGLAGFPFPGQTEFLAQRLGVRRYAMLAWSPRFKVIFVTIHMPLEYVASQITAQAVQEKIVLLDEFLRQENRHRFFKGWRPRIGVLALNPHGREFSLGEERRIERGVKGARRKGMLASGPFPADAIFAHLDDFDGFVAMYHDQAMIPAKILSRGRGVNVTLGLGKIRTSPLHGVAFDIAGQGLASFTSTLAAIRLARKLAR
ncbi:MAG: PdxA family dehydrogenase [bacterium]